MPATKSARRTPMGKSARSSSQRKLSATDKGALAEGRSMSATVNRYLEAVTAPKRRGRPISKATLEQRLVAAEERFKHGSGIDKLLAAQEKRDIQARLRATESAAGI